MTTKHCSNDHNDGHVDVEPRIIYFEHPHPYIVVVAEHHQLLSSNNGKDQLRIVSWGWAVQTLALQAPLGIFCAWARILCEWALQQYSGLCKVVYFGVGHFRDSVLLNLVGTPYRVWQFWDTLRYSAAGLCRDPVKGILDGSILRSLALYEGQAQHDIQSSNPTVRVENINQQYPLEIPGQLSYILYRKCHQPHT